MRIIVLLCLLATLFGVSEPRAADCPASDVSCWQQKAEQGDSTAQVALGMRYFLGLDFAQDYQLALEWFRKAAKQGHSAAQYGLGGMYAFGNGVPQDYQQAATWFRKAAEQGLAKSQFSLGEMYTFGHGVPQDYVQAHKFYNLAAARLTGEAQEEAARRRAGLAKKMTPQQIAEAQRLASEWKPKSD